MKRAATKIMMSKINKRENANDQVAMFAGPAAAPVQQLLKTTKRATTINATTMRAMTM